MIGRPVRVLCAALLCALVLAPAVSAEKVVALRIGAAWPWDVYKENTRMRLCGDAGFEGGAMFDRKFGLGFATNFLWNSVGDERIDTSNATHDTSYILTRERQSFMFPIGIFMLIDPVPKLIVHPTARFQIGYNSLIYNVRDSINTGGVDYYFGLYIRTGLDAYYDFGENTSVYVGGDYQWARTRTVSDRSNRYKRRDMGGLGVHVGFRAIF
jgi:hypothetical protein